MHPFGSDWLHASTPGHPGQLAALELLAQHRNQLRGTLCFEVPVDADARWQALEPFTTALCTCGRSRQLVPTVGRSRFASDTVAPRQVTLTSKQAWLYIAPTNGSFASRLLEVSLQHGILNCVPVALPIWERDIPQPFQLREVERRERHDFLYAHAGSLHDEIRRSGEVIVQVPVGDVLLPAFSVTSIDTHGREAKIELDAGMVRVGPNDAPAHRG